MRRTLAWGAGSMAVIAVVAGACSEETPGYSAQLDQSVSQAMVSGTMGPTGTNAPAMTGMGGGDVGGAAGSGGAEVGCGGVLGLGGGGTGGTGTGGAGRGGMGGMSGTGGASTGAGGSMSGGGVQNGGTGGGAGGIGGTGGTGGAGGTGGGGGGTGGSTGGSGGTGTAAYPFPQNIGSDTCIFPSAYDNADVLASYQLWKETVVTSQGASGFLRVRKPDSGSVIGSTVSEGIAYGMLLSVYMGDQRVFDGLWQYALLYLNDNGLMDWEISPQGSVIGFGAALDGDEDMAWALLMAHRQWGGAGSLPLDYLVYAIDLIEAIWEHEIDHDRDSMPLPGDSWGGVDVTNISYFAPAYYRVFGEVTDNVDGWNEAIDTSYEIIERSLNSASGNTDNGLVPAWCNFAGEPVEAYPGAPLHFQNDSTRTPFRIGQDYCYFGEPRALDYLEKITSFYTGVGVSNIVDGYELDGTPRPDFAQGGLRPASFVGPAAVGASHSLEHQAFVDEAYADLASGQLTAGTIYYQKSWSALSLLMLTGNFSELPQATD